MGLTEKELISLRDAIYQAFKKPDELIELLNQYEIFKGKLILKVNYENRTLLRDDYLNKLNIYDSSNHIRELLILEASDTHHINRKGEYSNIISEIYGNHFIKYDKSINDKNIVKSFDEIKLLISNEKYKICHFFGHGNNYEIQLEGQEKITLEQLEELLIYRTAYECVFFNLCNSETLAEKVSEHAEYVIGMSQQINDDVAINFAKNFYGGLQNGIDNNQDMFLRGFREGIQAISGDNNSQYKIPVLYINYKRAILNLIKQLDAENKIEDFLRKLHPKLSQDKKIIKIYNKYTYPIKQPDLLEFVKIVSQIKDWDLVKSAYRETLPKNAMVDNRELNNPKDITHIIDIFLEKYPFLSDDVPSILKFAKNLAGRFTKSSQQFEQIKSWIESLSPNVNTPRDVKPKDENLSITSKKTVFFIVIDPIEDKKFSLSAEYILNKEDTNSQPQPFDIEEHFNVDEKELPNKIKEIVETFIQDFIDEISIPTFFEIFLPYKYLGKNLDQEWRIHNEEKDKLITIVQNHILILHPKERFCRKDFLRYLRDKWLEITRLAETQSNTSLNDETIIKQLPKVNNSEIEKIGTYLYENQIIGVKLTSPLPEKEKEQQSFWRVVLKGGTPIVFWKRYHAEKQMDLNDINCHLKSEFLRDNCQKLIDNIRKERREAYWGDNPDEDKLGYHLGFLCDNPHRIPTILNQQKISLKQIK